MKQESAECKDFIHRIEPPSILLISLAIWVLHSLPGAGVSLVTGSALHGFGTRLPATLHVLPPQSPSIEPFKVNTTVFAGQTAYLNCIVSHLGDKTVSWIRRRDLHILTSGNHVYTSDPRVTLLRQGKLYNSWTLKIANVQRKDEGAYECQVNTEPKLTASLNLLVFGSLSDDSKLKAAGWRVHPMVHPSYPDMSSSPLQLDSNFQSKTKVSEARILGPPRLDLVEGSVGNLTCIISHPGLSPPNVTWFHDDVPVKQSSVVRGGMSIETEKSIFRTISKLVIFRVDWRDAGKYSCGGASVYPASVLIHVAAPNSVSGESGRESGGERKAGGLDKSESGLSVNDPRPIISIAASLHHPKYKNIYLHFPSSIHAALVIFLTFSILYRCTYLYPVEFKSVLLYIITATFTNTFTLTFTLSSLLSFLFPSCFLIALALVVIYLTSTASIIPILISEGTIKNSD